MNNREKHKNLLKQSFSCEFMRPVLSEKDYSKLCDIGSWMDALYKGTIEPITNQQRKFLVDINQQSPPTEENALLFWKFLKRNELRQEGNLKAEKAVITDDREDWKKIRKMRF